MTKRTASEASIERNIVRKMFALGAYGIKIHAEVGNFGEPDRIFSLKDLIGYGRTIVIEVKRPGKKPTMIQIIKLKKWEKAGALAIVATSWEDVVEKLQKEGLVE